MVLLAPGRTLPLATRPMSRATRWPTHSQNPRTRPRCSQSTPPPTRLPFSRPCPRTHSPGCVHLPPAGAIFARGPFHRRASAAAAPSTLCAPSCSGPSAHPALFHRHPAGPQAADGLGLQPELLLSLRHARPGGPDRHLALRRALDRQLPRQTGLRPASRPATQDPDGADRRRCVQAGSAEPDQGADWIPGPRLPPRSPQSALRRPSPLPSAAVPWPPARRVFSNGFLFSVLQENFGPNIASFVNEEHVSMHTSKGSAARIASGLAKPAQTAMTQAHGFDSLVFEERPVLARSWLYQPSGALPLPPSPPSCQTLSAAVPLAAMLSHPVCCGPQGMSGTRR